MDRPDPAVSIVLPTYNESEALPSIVPRIHETLEAAGIAHEILVVDDASPDGTADVADELAARYPVRVIRRTTDRGLAKAVLAGFAEARAPLCVVMDADGSHPVEALPTMVEMLQDDKADIVVGSRHVEGGGSRDWPVFSQLKSKVAASVTFGLTSMTDPTTGFMAVKKHLLEGLELDPVGWKIVLEVVVKASPARVAEIPIIFADREHGESKQSLEVAMEYAEHLAKLYAHRYPALFELLKFCIVGVVGLVIDMLTVVTSKELVGLDTRLCAVLGFSVAVTTNYLFNRYWTFPLARSLPFLWSYLTYVGTNMVGLSVRMLAVHLLIVLAGLDQGYDYVWTNLVGIALATIFNFVGAKYFAFDPERLTFSEPRPEPASASMRPEPPLPVVPVAAVVGLSLALSLAWAIFGQGLSAHDEGVNATMAANMLASGERVLRPSVFPGGGADWVTDDLPALGNTPFYPALLAIAREALGFHGMAVVSWLALVAVIFFGYRLVSIFDRRAGLIAALLMATSPALLQQLASIEFEPVLSGFCMAGLYCFARGTRQRRRGASLLGGALVGLGFLTKMWLIAPFVFAACALVLVEATLARVPGEERFRLRGSILAASAGFALTAGAHLAVVAVTHPEDLGDWVSSVYLGIFSGTGVTGDKLSAVGRYAGKPEPPWYYPLQLFRDHFHLVPLILFGLPALVRRARPRGVAVLAMSFGALLSLVPLSVPAVKEPLYALAVAPFGYLLAGSALAELATDAPTYRSVDNMGVRVAIVVAAVSAVSVTASHLVAGTVSTEYAAIHVLGMAAVAAVGVAELRAHKLAPALVAASALALCGHVLQQWVLAPENVYPQIAAALAQPLDDAPPAEPSFEARDHGILQGYLWRRGRPLSTANADTDARTRAWVFTPADLSRPELASLADRLASKHRTLEAPAPGYRIIVR